MGTWIPLFWTSGDFWVSKPGWICHLRVSPPACNGFLRFTSGATPADLLAATMTAEPLSIHVLAHVHTIIGRVRVSNSIFGFQFFSAPSTKMLPVPLVAFYETNMSHFSYACKTERQNGISHLISELLHTLDSSLRDHLFHVTEWTFPNSLIMQTC